MMEHTLRQLAGTLVRKEEAHRLPRKERLWSGPQVGEGGTLALALPPASNPLSASSQPQTAPHKSLLQAGPSPFLHLCTP